MRGPAVRAMVSVVAALLTVSIAGLLVLLPYSKGRDVVSDFLALPGALIAGIFYPAGVHTGSGSPGWAGLALASNILFYALLWFGILTGVRSPRRRQKRSGPSEAERDH